LKRKTPLHQTGAVIWIRKRNERDPGHWTGKVMKRGFYSENNETRDGEVFRTTEGVSKGLAQKRGVLGGGGRGRELPFKRGSFFIPGPKRLQRKRTVI